MSDVAWSILIFGIFTTAAAIIAGVQTYRKAKRERYDYRFYPAHQPATGPAPVPASKPACPTTLYTYTPTGRDYGAAAGLLIIAAVAVHYLRKGNHNVR